MSAVRSTASGGDFEGIWDGGDLPDTVHRRCTDMTWILVALISYAGFFGVMALASSCADISRHDGFKNGHGQSCGLNSMTPYLFFCNNYSALAYTGSLELDIFHGVCIERCPVSRNDTVLECEDAPSYGSRQIMGMFCKPLDMSVFTRHVHRVEGYIQAAKVRVLLQIFVERWGSLLCCWTAGVIASWIEIYLLESHAGGLVRIGMFTMTVGCLISGCYLMGWFSWIHLHPPISPYVLPSAMVLLAIGTFFVGILWTAQDSVHMATACVELACVCVMQTPSLSMQPLLMSVLHLMHVFAAVYGVLAIGSCPCAHTETVHDHERSLTEHWGSLAIMLLAICTSHMISFALAEFLTAYGTVIWYFSRRAEALADEEDATENQKLRRAKRSLICKSVWQAWRYHFGSMVLGGLIIGWSRVFRLPLKVLVGWTNLDNPTSRFFRFLCCHLNSVYTALRVWSRVAFIDMAMNANSFYDSVANAQMVTRKESEAVRILHGATWLFQVVGVAGNASMGACIMLFYSSQVKEDDPNVALIMCCLGAVFAGVSCFPFAVIFDTVADTILYCYVIEELRQRRQQEQEQLLIESPKPRRCGNCISREGRDSFGVLQYLCAPNANGAPGETESLWCGDKPLVDSDVELDKQLDEHLGKSPKRTNDAPCA